MSTLTRFTGPLRAIVGSDRFAGGIEQLISSAVSMLGLIVLSRVMAIDEFGMLSGAIGIWLTMEMVQHALVISPFVVSCPEPTQTPRVFGAWMVWNLVLAGLACLAFIALGAVLAPLLPVLGASLGMAGPLTLAGMAYMFSRRVQYHLRQRRKLLAQAGLYGLSYVTALGLILGFADKVDLAGGALVLCAAYGVPALVFNLLLFRHGRPDRHAARHIWGAAHLIARLGAASMLWQASYTISLIALTVWSSPAAIAVYTVTRTLVRPVTLLISTVCDVDFSRASRALATGGKEALRPVIAESGRVLLLLTAPPIALLLAFPGFFLELLFGPQYAGATLELQLWTLLFIPLVYVAVLDIGLTVQRDLAFLIRAHAVSLASGLVLLAGFVLLGQLNAATALVSLVCARAVSAPLMHFRYRFLLKDAGSPAAFGTAASAHGR
jgi:O-antigen/teichoic acid export membrane protein